MTGKLPHIPGKILVVSTFGSHVYGTNIPTSDTDIKGVFIPDGRDILMQRAAKTSITVSTKSDVTKKNSTEDVDTEFFSLAGFIRLLSEGQTAAIDMLFTPQRFWHQSSPVWEELQKEKHRLIHKQATSFVGYCQTQAAKYGVKGSYISALKEVLGFLESIPLYERLHQHETKLRELANTIDHVHIIPITHPKTNITLEYLSIRNTKVEFNATVKYALEIFKDKLEKYGERARMAETNEGVDWKATMHAVRVCFEAEELLKTGHVTLPLPQADLLLKIRKAELPYAQVAEMIEEGVQRVKAAEAASTLPNSIDTKFWEDFVCHHYSNAILESVRSPGWLVQR